jgi:uncharacterized membrane protein
MTSDPPNVAVHAPTLNSGIFSKALVVIAILAVALGTFFRCYHLDRKVYGGDEIYSSLRILGDAEAPLVREAPRLHDVRALWAILHPAPSAGANGPIAVIRALASEEPHQAPLYFELGHIWVGLFGNSIAAIRSMSVVAGLLGLPCAFWFGCELYRSRAAGWISLALFALSPVLVAYAQQAREYALWSTLVLASGAATLRALRLDRARPWWLVGILMTLALYTDPLTLPVAAGFAGSVLLTRWQERTALTRCGLAFGGALLAYFPWLVVIFVKFGAVEHSLGSELEAKLSLFEILRVLAGSLKLNFVDLGFFSSSMLGIVSTAAVLVVIVYSLVFVMRHEPWQRWLFLLLPILLSTLPFILADLLFSGQRIRQARYFIPCYLCVDYLVVGVLVAKTIRSGLRAWPWYVALCSLLFARGVSCAVSSRAVTWWSTQWDNSIAAAQVVNQAREPVLVSDDYLLYSLALANYLRPDIKVVLRPRCYECLDRSTPGITTGMLPRGPFTDAFALGPSPELQQLLRAWVRRGDVRAAYHCINVRRNCTSSLNVEPIFGSGSTER